MQKDSDVDGPKNIGHAKQNNIEGQGTGHKEINTEWTGAGSI